MAIVKKAMKGKYLNSLEKYHVFLTSKQGMRTSESSTDNINATFELM
jgi:hypothetical protein